jgi:hypothetical protein
MPAKNPKEYSKKHYKTYKEKYLEASKKARLKRREWYEDFMKDKFCTKCGISDVAVLEWHHLDPDNKVKEVSRLMHQKGRKTILEEIAKCICVCSNCHRKIHYHERGQNRS